MEDTQNEAYQGWKNYNTWNVALWLQSDEFLNMEASKFHVKGYYAFVEYMKTWGGDISFQTPDKVRWDDPTLDIASLNRIMRNF